MAFPDKKLFQAWKKEVSGRSKTAWPPFARQGTPSDCAVHFTYLGLETRLIFLPSLLPRIMLLASKGCQNLQQTDELHPKGIPQTWLYWGKIYIHPRYSHLTVNTNAWQVVSPNMFSKDLWEQSGHWEHFKENMFRLTVEGQEYALKPMNCPGHCLMYKFKSHSYRELPIRFADFGVIHQNELSGALTGTITNSWLIRE